MSNVFIKRNPLYSNIIDSFSSIESNSDQMSSSVNDLIRPLAILDEPSSFISFKRNDIIISSTTSIFQRLFRSTSIHKHETDVHISIKGILITSLILTSISCYTIQALNKR